MCEEAKRNFRRNELFNMAWGASVQHSKTYTDITKEQKKQLRDTIKDKLDIWIFKKPISLENYISHVVGLSKEITRKYREWLAPNQRDGRFRIGTSQKICGLYLKHLWCAGEVKWRPPACPFDAKILRKIGLPSAAWTKMDDEEQLKDWIEKATQKAAENPQYQRSIAIWELSVFEELR